MKHSSTVFFAILLWSAGFGASLGDSNEDEARPAAHLAAAICSNSLVMVDTFANIRRIESLVAVLDTGDAYKAEHYSAAVAHP